VHQPGSQRLFVGAAHATVVVVRVLLRDRRTLSPVHPRVCALVGVLCRNCLSALGSRGQGRRAELPRVVGDVDRDPRGTISSMRSSTSSDRLVLSAASSRRGAPRCADRCLDQERPLGRGRSSLPEAGAASPRPFGDPPPGRSVVVGILVERRAELRGEHDVSRDVDPPAPCRQSALTARGAPISIIAPTHDRADRDAGTSQGSAVRQGCSSAVVVSNGETERVPTLGIAETLLTCRDGANTDPTAASRQAEALAASRSEDCDYAERRIPVSPICKEFQITRGITDRAA
jgi:hypothetical protein